MQTERITAITAPKLMLLNAKIAKIQNVASCAHGADAGSADAQRLAKLLEERTAMHQQQEHDLEQVRLLCARMHMQICVSCVHK